MFPPFAAVSSSNTFTKVTFTLQAATLFVKHPIKLTVTGWPLQQISNECHLISELHVGTIHAVTAIQDMCSRKHSHRDQRAESGRETRWPPDSEISRSDAYSRGRPPQKIERRETKYGGRILKECP